MLAKGAIGIGVILATFVGPARIANAQTLRTATSDASADHRYLSVGLRSWASAHFGAQKQALKRAAQSGIGG
jgi:hypothetical protein